MSDTSTENVSIESVADELKRVQETFDEKMGLATTLADAESLRREYLSKKGPVNKVMEYMRNLSSEDKPKLGAVVNAIKEEMEASVTTRSAALEEAAILRQMEDERIDVTLPGVTRMADIGRRHPLSLTMERAVEIFIRLGYDTVTNCKDSPEIETDYYCFEALNCPKDHPARDMQDTFYLTADREYMLRTHTSSVQIRQLEQRKPPLRIVAPGRVYRRDDVDATHSLMFHQVEILAIEKRGELTLGHLKGTVEYFLQSMFGPDIQVRFRGSYFPFTEPSMEVDVFFRGKWLEVLGCGMVDPDVLTMAGLDPNEYSGFAAGFGVERFAMVIYGITDIREFYKSDKRFLQQFPHFSDDGLEAFMRGGTRLEDSVDPRGETVPDPPVNSLEELVERAAEEKVNGSVVEDKAQVVENSESAAASSSSEIDISKLDIRVGVIVKAWKHEEADKLFCEEIDIGEGEPRQIASGLREHYKVEELANRRVLVLSNLKARKLMGFSSHGMVLCATGGDGKVMFVEPPPDSKVGERVMVDGFDGEPATENQVIKKKMLEEIFPDLKTNGEGVACYRGTPLITSAGPCDSGLSNAAVQ